MQHRALKMAVTIVVAAVLAGSTAVCLGLVDAGRAIDATLEQLDYQAMQLNHSIHAAVARGEPVDPEDRSRASVERRVSSLAGVADGILSEHAPPYVRALSRTLGDAFNLVPPSEAIHEALTAYLEHADQASKEAAQSAGAADVQSRLLELNYDALALKISQARERAGQGISSALTALQLITFVSIGIGAMAVGLTP